MLKKPLIYCNFQKGEKIMLRKILQDIFMYTYLLLQMVCFVTIECLWLLFFLVFSPCPGLWWVWVLPAVVALVLLHLTFQTLFILAWSLWNCSKRVMLPLSYPLRRYLLHVTFRERTILRNSIDILYLWYNFNGEETCECIISHNSSSPK